MHVTYLKANDSWSPRSVTGFGMKAAIMLRSNDQLGVMMKQSIQTEFSDTRSLEKFLLSLILGFLCDIEMEVMTTKDAERILLNPFRNEKLAKFGVSKTVLEIFEQSFFIDDSANLGSVSLSGSINNLRQKIYQYLDAVKNEKCDMSIRFNDDFG
jgi:Protein of unknown function (DUF3969)